MELSTEAKFGFLVGIIIGLAIVAIAMALKKKKWVFDERQQLARGKAFKAAYITLLISMFLLRLVQEFADAVIFGTFMVELVALFISLAVFAIVCIFNDAYLSLNERPKTVMLVASGIALLNLGIGLMNIHNMGAAEKAALPLVSINLICAGVLAAIVIVFGVRTAIVHKRMGAGADEESEA